LAFGRECELYDESLLGTKATIVADTVAYDDRIAALVVDRGQVEKLGVNNEHPHITLAIFDHSTKPVYSNQLLDSGDYELVEFPEDKIELRGQVLAVTKNPVPQK
jgi:tRNA splicing ligase